MIDGYDQGSITIVATGSEVGLAVRTADKLKERGITARVVSAPCLDLFDRQPIDYQNEVLGTDRGAIVTIEAGRTSGWYK